MYPYSTRPSIFENPFFLCRRVFSLMTNPVITTFLSQLLYPLTLTGVGVLRNVYVLGALVEDVQQDIKDVQHDMRDIQKDIKGLLARQVEQEARTTTLVQRYMKGCGK